MYGYCISNVFSTMLRPWHTKEELEDNNKRYEQEIKIKYGDE